jgi:hypothetical protein
LAIAVDEHPAGNRKEIPETLSCPAHGSLRLIGLAAILLPFGRAPERLAYAPQAGAR